MDSISKSQSLNYDTDEIRFGDDNQKAEKAKQSFLTLKHKIFLTHDLIQRLSSRDKECERLRAEVETVKKDAEKWKTEHFASLTKILKFNSLKNEYDKNIKMLNKENSKLKEQLGGDEKLLAQWMSKVDEIEADHSKALMIIELEKSGLESKIADLEQEIKILHTTYDIKKSNTQEKNIEKSKRRKKIKSPMKTSRSIGLLPEIDNEISLNVEDISVPTSSTINTVNTIEIENNIIRTEVNLPILSVDNTKNDKFIMSPKRNLSDCFSIQKPSTCDKSIMTDEFYNTNKKVYPLLCDKCEISFDFVSVDNIFKIMTAHPPLISAVPPSPVRSKSINHNTDTIDAPDITCTSVQTDSNVSLINTSVQNDPNLSLTLEKVQKTLESLEKQIKKNKSTITQNKISHCNHSIPKNCCNSNNDSFNMTNFSQVNMMTALWSSMMKFTDEKLQKRRVKRKKVTNLKRKLRTMSRQKVKIKNSKKHMNSWIVESDTSFDTDREMTIETTPGESSGFLSKHKARKKKSIKNIEMTSQNSDTSFRMSPDIQQHITDKFNCHDNSENSNLFEEPSTSTPNNHSINSNFSIPNIMTRRSTRSLSIDSTQPPINEDSTMRKQTRPANITKSVPKSRTGLLQKLRRLGKNKKPINACINPTKLLDYIEPLNESAIPIEDHTPGIKKRVAHVNKVDGKESDVVSSENNELLVKKNIIERSKEILNSKKRKITRSMTKTVDNPESKLSNTMEIDLIHTSNTQEYINEKVKSKNVLSNTINNLFGSHCDTKNMSDEISKEVDTVFVDNHIENSSLIKNDTLECNESNNDGLTVLNIVNETIKVPVALSVVTEENNDKTDDIVDEKEKKNDEIISESMEKNSMKCLSEKIQVNISNESEEINSELIDNDVILQNCETSGKLINSMNLSSNNENNIIDIIHTIPQTHNAKSLLINSNEISPDANKHTLRKRRRINSDTESGSASSSPCLSEKKKKISLMSSNNSTDELRTITAVRSRKSLIPEIIQNEIGKFFKTKRIMTRSMRKTEESLSPIVKDNSPQHHENSKNIKKLKTPVNEANNTPILASKNFVKNLFPVDNNEKRKISNNIINNLTEESTISDIEIVNSMENISNIQKHNTPKKSEELIINVSPTKVYDKSLILPIVNEVKIFNCIEENNLIDKIDEKETINEINSSKTIVKIENIDVYSQENMDINITKDQNVTTNSMNIVEKIPEPSSTCEYDSPLSPDANSDSIPEYSIPSNSNASLTITDNDIFTNEHSISAKQLNQQPQNSQEIQKEASIKHNDSVRELRYRSVPMIPHKVTAIQKNNSLYEYTNNEITRKPKNIKELLDRHLEMSKKNNEAMKNKRYHTLAARNVTEEIIETIKQQISRLTDLPNWDNSIYQSVIDNLTKINSNKTIAKAVVNLICKLSLLNEPLDKTHTPPAPMMTQSQQKIIALLVNLDKIKPELINMIFNVINHNLFSIGMSLEIEEIQSLTRIYVSLCKIKKDRERVRIMICDALYSLQSKSVIIIHIALTSWTEVLPIYNENSRQYLPLCIVHIIRHHNTKKNDVETKANQLRNLLKNYYNYPEEKPLSTNLLDDFLNELTAPNHDINVITAIVLLAKKEGTEWTYKNIIKERLLKIIIENKNSSSYDALVLLGYLVKCFPLNDPDGAVKSIVEQLCAIHNAGTTPVDIQEGVVMALMLLGTRHYKYSGIYRSILTWQPPRQLSPAIQRQLEIFFDSRAPHTWRQII